MKLDRIRHNPEVTGGKPALRGMRATVGTVVGLVATGSSFGETLKACLYLEEDIKQALACAAWRAEELE